MRDKIIEVLKKIEDPDVFLDIWFLGLIYQIDYIEDEQRVKILMTFTTPLCPAGPDLVQQVNDRILELDGVSQVEVEITFDPPWAPNDDVKALLGLI